MKRLELNKLEVLWDNILLDPIIEEEEDGGVIKPNQYEDKAEMGTVVKIGEGRLLDNGTWVKPRVKVGDLVLFNMYSPTKIKIEGHEYLYIREEDIVNRQS